MKDERLTDILETEEMRKIPFSVPEGYFDSLEDRLSESIFHKNKESWISSLKKTLKPVMTLAASFLIVAAMGWGVMRLTKLSQNKIALNSQEETSEESTDLMDSLINRYGAIEIAEIYSNPPIETDNTGSDILSQEESDVLEEYITVMAPSFPGLIAEELSNSH